MYYKTNAIVRIYVLNTIFFHLDMIQVLKNFSDIGIDDVQTIFTKSLLEYLNDKKDCRFMLLGIYKTFTKDPFPIII